MINAKAIEFRRTSVRMRCGNSGVQPEIRGSYANDGELPPEGGAVGLKLAGSATKEGFGR